MFLLFINLSKITCHHRDKFYLEIDMSGQIFIFCKPQGSLISKSND